MGWSRLCQEASVAKGLRTKAQQSKRWRNSGSSAEKALGCLRARVKPGRKGLPTGTKATSAPAQRRSPAAAGRNMLSPSPCSRRSGFSARCTMAWRTSAKYCATAVTRAASPSIAAKAATSMVSFRATTSGKRLSREQTKVVPERGAPVMMIDLGIAPRGIAAEVQACGTAYQIWWMSLSRVWNCARSAAKEWRSAVSLFCCSMAVRLPGDWLKAS